MTKRTEVNLKGHTWLDLALRPRKPPLELAGRDGQALSHLALERAAARIVRGGLILCDDKHKMKGGRKGGREEEREEEGVMVAVVGEGGKRI
jgi:hypothetical protein